MSARARSQASLQLGGLGLGLLQQRGDVGRGVGRPSSATVRGDGVAGDRRGLPVLSRRGIGFVVAASSALLNEIIVRRTAASTTAQ